MSASDGQQRASGRSYLRLIGIAALIGIPAAFLAALFLGAVHVVERWLWDDLPAALGLAQPPWFLVLGLPVVGAAIVLVARRFLPGDGGAPPLHGLRTEPTPVANVPGVVLAALVVLVLLLTNGFAYAVSLGVRVSGWADIPGHLPGRRPGVRGGGGAGHLAHPGRLCRGGGGDGSADAAPLFAGPAGVAAGRAERRRYDSGCGAGHDRGMADGRGPASAGGDNGAGGRANIGLLIVAVAAP